jgi:hypothetical protein
MKRPPDPAGQVSSLLFGVRSERTGAWYPILSSSSLGLSGSGRRRKTPGPPNSRRKGLSRGCWPLRPATRRPLIHHVTPRVEGKPIRTDPHQILGGVITVSVRTRLPFSPLHPLRCSKSGCVGRHIRSSVCPATTSAGSSLPLPRLLMGDHGGLVVLDHRHHLVQATFAAGSISQTGQRPGCAILIARLRPSPITP